MKELVLSGLVTIDSWVLYLIMGVLLVGNILFILLFILSVTRNNRLEEQISETLRNTLSKKTEFDKTRSQPLGARPEDKKNSLYKVVPARDKVGWYIFKQGEETPLSYVVSKQEADEIIKSIARKE